MTTIYIKQAIEDLSRAQETELLRWMIDRQWGKLIPAVRPGGQTPVQAPVSGLVPNWPAIGLVEEWWRGKLVNGDLLPRRGWSSPIVIHDMAIDYSDALGLGSFNFRGTASSMGRHLARLVPGLDIITATAGFGMGVKTRCYGFPPLEICRADFEGMYGPQLWREVGEVVWERDADCREEQVPD